MRLIDADAIDRILDFGAVTETLERAFVAGFSGPARHHHALDQDSGATQLLMPAWTNDLPGADSFLGTKIVSVFPQNRAHDIPAVNGTYVLQSGETGLPLAAIDGTRLTHWRTAAVSALGAKYLARADARTLLICGSGALAPMLIAAHSGMRPIQEILVWNHRRTGAETLVAALAAKDLNARVADDLAEAVAQADIVSCATLAREPFLHGDWLSPGTHVDLVGAFKLNMREADDVALQRARIFIDTERALSEGGEVASAIAGGAIARDHVLGTLAELIRGTVAGRGNAREITLFKSVGTSIADLAVAILVWQRVAASERSPSSSQSQTLVKICGLSSAPTLDAALQSGADMVGFVFFAPSPRNLSLDQARALAGQVRGRAHKVALTVDADDALLEGIVDALAPDILQLHGKESPERVRGIRVRFGIPVMKALGIASRGDLDKAAAYGEAADTLLFDAKPAPEAVLPGGNGQVFDWAIVKGFALCTPWMLSGGLDAGNVAEALTATGARGVDVSSGVETAPGTKDPARIAAFIAAVRGLSPASGVR